jgi:phosphate transport system permease protein
MASVAALKAQIKKHVFLDQLFLQGTRLFACLLLILFGGIVVYLFEGSLPALHTFGWAFLSGSAWNPVTQQFGALPAIAGTLLTSAIALIIAVPVSFGIAVCLTEFAPRWSRRPLRIAIELLAGIPSIIYGMWGLFIFAPYMAAHIQPWMIDKLGNLPVIGMFFEGVPLGIGVLTAGIILGIMIIPFIASVMRDVFEIVPDLLKEAAYGLGATTWEVIWRVVLPYTRAGVIGGIFLGLGRALGETMAVAFVIGNAHQLTASLLMPGSTISSVLANEFTEATGKLYNAALMELGLILFIMTFLIIFFSKLLLNYVNKQKKESR